MEMDITALSTFFNQLEESQKSDGNNGLYYQNFQNKDDQGYC